MLFQKEGDWLTHLKKYGLNEELFVNRTILNTDEKTILIKYIKNIESVIKIMKKEILITKEMLLVWNVRNVEEKNIAKMGL